MTQLNEDDAAKFNALMEISETEESPPEAKAQEVDQTEKVAVQAPDKIQEEMPTQEREYSEIELEAMKKGWRPKDQFEDGDEKEYKSAETFLALEPYIKQNHDLKRSMKKLKEQVSKIEQQNYKKIKAELEAQFTTSVQESDVEKAQRIQKEIMELAKPESGPEVPEAVLAFKERNPWYDNPQTHEDYEKIGIANAVDAMYAQKHPDDVEGSIQAVEARIQELYGKKKSKAEENLEKLKSTAPPVTPAKPKVSKDASNKLDLNSFDSQTIQLATQFKDSGLYDTVEAALRDMSRG